LGPLELKMRVNSLGPEFPAKVGVGADAALEGTPRIGGADAFGAAAIGGALAAGGAPELASGEFIERNTEVKLPGSLPLAFAAGDGG
jgi:hypothetical protein